MALYPNTPFSEGSLWTPDLAYQAFNSPVFDDLPQYLGHRAKIDDTELSDAAGKIKSRVAAIADGFKLTQGSGLTVNYASGSLCMADGTLLTVPGGAVVCPNNTTSFVYIGVDGAVRTSSNPPVIRLLLAKVVTVSGVITSLQDLRDISVRRIEPIAASIKVFGGSNATDKTCTNGETLDLGYYYFRDFNVPAGITITIDKFAKIICSGTVTIAGTININPAAAGAVGFATGVSTSNIGGYAGGGAGGGSGSLVTGGGSAYNFAAQAYGSGGGLGYISGTSGNGTLGSGGGGGGGLWIEASSAITVTGSIFAKGVNGGSASGATGAVNLSGSGGGSGGLILLSSLQSVTVSGTLDVRGGSGGNAYGDARGGGGGGGGFIVVMSPNNNTTGSSLLITGGVAGTDTGTTLGGGAGGGFGGRGGANNSATASGVGRLINLGFTPIG